MALIMAVIATFPTEAAVNYVKKLRGAKAIEVTYESSYKGRTYPGATIVSISGEQVRISTADNGRGRRGDAPVQNTYIDYATRQWYKVAQLPGGREISSARDFASDSAMRVIGREKVLGLDCTVARTSINSNTIDICYTDALPFEGTPQPGVGVPSGLVLKVTRNGESVQEAVDIKAFRPDGSLFPAQWGERLSDPEYLYAINQSGVITVPVFDHARINFSGAAIPDALNDGEVYNVGGGTIVIRKVTLPDSAAAADRSIFAEVVQYSEGDAYDRTGSIFVIPTGKKQSFVDAIRNLKSVPAFVSDSTAYHGLVSTDGYDAPLELMRFFTGFGVRAFNKNVVPGQEWVDSVLYKTEISDLASHLSGEQWIGAYIGNWDGRGHILSLDLKYYPGGGDRKFMAMPLFNTVNYLEQAGQPYPIFMLNDSLQTEFTLDHPVENAMLCYTTTGHGGWGGGDEFNKKTNTIILDGREVITFIPWRDDCGTYRNNNPCSGNFANGLSSSDLSRSNWCPGTVTNPEYIYLGNLAAGKHKLTVKIPQGKPAGSSNSYWCISGTLLY